MKTPGNVIVNSPFDVPQRHWVPQRDGTLQLVESRRAASYEIYDVRNNTRRVETLDQVNEICQGVEQWRADDYPGITTVTRQLLAHWFDRSARQHPFYFCQLEAIETLIWWVEAVDAYRQGVFLQGDGRPWERVCSKMATGSGKTTVMAMLITWQVLNAVTYPKRNKGFSRVIFIVAPGLTVKERLQVLYPGSEANAYDEFWTCPSESLRHKLNQAEVLVENWHKLMPAKEQERSVVKKGCLARCEELPVQAPPPVSRPGCAGRREPPRCRTARGGSAETASGRLRPAGGRLARCVARLAGRPPPFAAGDVDRVQPCGDCGAHRALPEPRRRALA